MRKDEQKKCFVDKIICFWFKHSNFATWEHLRSDAIRPPEIIPLDLVFPVCDAELRKSIFPGLNKENFVLDQKIWQFCGDIWIDNDE